MEHRQLGYGFLFVIAACTVAIVSSNCSAPFSSCGDGTCITTSGLAGAGGTTSSTSGSGGMIATGGGPPAGGSGGSPTGGSTGAGGTGGQGGVVSPVYCGPDQVSIPTTGIVVCWYLNENHPPGTTLGLGGVIRQPGHPEVTQPTFVGCETANPSQSTLICPFGNLAIGTDFIFDPYATDGATTFIRCDVTGLPTSKCFGEYWLFANGVEIGHFIDPPTGRWTYDDSGSHLRLVYTDPT